MEGDAWQEFFLPELRAKISAQRSDYVKIFRDKSLINAYFNEAMSEVFMSFLDEKGKVSVDKMQVRVGKDGALKFAER
jgi:hypothetical protein